MLGIVPTFESIPLNGKIHTKITKFFTAKEAAKEEVVVEDEPLDPSSPILDWSVDLRSASQFVTEDLGPHKIALELALAETRMKLERPNGYKTSFRAGSL